MSKWKYTEQQRTASKLRMVKRKIGGYTNEVNPCRKEEQVRMQFNKFGATIYDAVKMAIKDAQPYFHQ